MPARRWAGAGLALGGLALIAVPGAVALQPLVLMAAAGVGWGVYSLARARGEGSLGGDGVEFPSVGAPGAALGGLRWGWSDRMRWE